MADRINTEFGTVFAGRSDLLDVSHHRQRRAIACHRSQSSDNPILRRRLQLLGDHGHLMLVAPDKKEGQPCPTASPSA